METDAAAAGTAFVRAARTLVRRRFSRSSPTDAVERTCAVTSPPRMGFAAQARGAVSAGDRAGGAVLKVASAHDVGRRSTAGRRGADHGGIHWGGYAVARRRADEEAGVNPQSWSTR